MTFDPTDLTRALDERLRDADSALAQQFPGERPTRQPVHTVYVPADRYDAGLVPAWGAQALAVLDEHGGTAQEYAALLGLPAELADDVVTRVRAKLAAEPIEDLRIDFEDGYGAPGEEVEDAAVKAAAADLLTSLAARTAAPFNGIRFKCFESPTRARGIRTLAGFVEAVAAPDGTLPDGFVVTLPKVTSVDQVEAMVQAAEAIEAALGLGAGALRFEIQVETPQSILGPDGTALVARMVHASAGRCTGLHYGTYDYSASAGIAAAYQSMEHPAADHAKAVMQVAAAGTGVRLSDGSTNILPVGDRDAVHRAWALHARLVRRSLERGFYQGWDLHPAQLPSRYAATYAFFREGLPAATERLRNYVGRVESGVMDEPATARALADFVVRGLDCGATDEQEVQALSGLDRAAIDRLAKRTSA
ncbi:Citrate lyase beta subunit [Pedococcus dokdonensis]|uniref:Citrate lyase beta subunit n=1 Tax=Pedococcus dokdonensis TaxID=443156 RepID=A0A1H0UK82_9MICO|nr:aldolase/citrate lyase family protein [Pedococcus dokdonensis]SDP66712.1 Citrate lyase beta subunit [Pedococcus dokdonensis]